MVTIFQTRYRGAYEGGLWAAVYAQPHEIASEAWEGDVYASGWWHDHASEVGVGDTPDAALADLHSKHQGGSSSI
jgi:hypothetical protein